MNKWREGFTLIELVVVITILSLLAAFALPRFVEVADEAHRSSVAGTGGALAAAVALVRSQWTANGHRGAVENLQGFGRGDVDVSPIGWPVGTTGLTRPADISAADCRDLWNALLQSNAPSVSLAGGQADYRVTLDEGRCRYTYTRNAQDHHLIYDPTTGEVTTFINSPLEKPEKSTILPCIGN